MLSYIAIGARSVENQQHRLVSSAIDVPVGMKIADIDPRKEEKKNCFTISDKARCIAGSVVEILLSEGVLPNTL